MKWGQAKEIRRKFTNAVQAIAKNSPKIYDAFLLFDPWEAGVTYQANQKIRYGNQLYFAITDHTSQADWTPDVTASLYTAIANPNESGTADNPISYNGNMALEEGKYYIQTNVIYHCIRDTINPVFNDLADLVGLYVEVYA